MLFTISCGSGEVKKPNLQQETMRELLREDFLLKNYATIEMNRGKNITAVLKFQIQKMKELEDRHKGNIPAEFRDKYALHKDEYEIALHDIETKEIDMVAKGVKWIISAFGSPTAFVFSTIKTAMELNKNLNDQLKHPRINQTYESLKRYAEASNVKLVDDEQVSNLLPNAYTIKGEIDSKKEWQTLYGLVTAKSNLIIETTGQWSITNNGNQLNANGTDKSPSDWFDYRVDKKFNYGALICRIVQTEKEKDFPIFSLGNSTADKDGVLECRINDTDTGNNTGSLEVSIIIKKS